MRNEHKNTSFISLLLQTKRTPRAGTEKAIGTPRRIVERRSMRDWRMGAGGREAEEITHKS